MMHFTNATFKIKYLLHYSYPPASVLSWFCTVMGLTPPVSTSLPRPLSGLLTHS